VTNLISILAWILGLLVLAVALGIGYQLAGTRRDRRIHPPPGRLIDLGTHRLHLYETGRAGPTILLESGLMSTVLGWTEVQRELSKSFRVLSYDRAGLGWSELGPMPRTAERIVDELHHALEKACIAPPYILVGHSFGGLTMQLFAARYPKEVTGMVLIDAVVPAEWDPPSEQDAKNSRVGAKVCRRAAGLACVGVIRLVAALLRSPLKNVAGHLVRLISRGTPSNSGTVSSPWFFALPPNERAMAAVFWIQPMFALTIASQLENLPLSAKQVGKYKTFCDKKVIFLSAASASVRRREGHAAIAARLPLGEHIVVGESNHWIMQNHPELVIRAIQSIVGETDQPPTGASAGAAQEA
jgi:pimeloyl-ACP methyl ester carboxylesterase